MTIIEFNGGLGNQLFQYAAARSISQNGLYWYFNSQKNQSNNNNTTFRNFELKIFKNIKLKQKLFKTLLINNTFIYRVFRKLIFGNITLVKQEHSNLIYFNNLKYETIYLKGYFQNEKYFLHIRDILIKELEFPKLDFENIKIANRILSENESICLHVRRGDYLLKVNSSIHGILDKNYYIEATNYFKKYLKNPYFFVFSDDIEWCKNNLSELGLKLFFINSNYKYSWKDLYLMSICKNHIVANSSFSWWGAWLSKNDGIKVAPKRWYFDVEMNELAYDIVPSSWVRL